MLPRLTDWRKSRTAELTGIDLWRSRSRLEIAVTRPYGHDHGQPFETYPATVMVSFGPSKTASLYLAVTADGLCRSSLHARACDENYNNNKFNGSMNIYGNGTKIREPDGN